MNLVKHVSGLSANNRRKLELLADLMRRVLPPVLVRGSFSTVEFRMKVDDGNIQDVEHSVTEKHR